MCPDKVFEMIQPVRVLFGRGQLAKLGEIVTSLGRRVILFTMRELSDLGLAERALSALRRADLEVMIFDKVQQEPTCTHIDCIAEQVTKWRAEVLVALGGGSVIDVAKAVAIRATHPEPTWMYVNLSNRPPLAINPTVLPVVAIPTTAGTGSEVTPYAVISNEEVKQKGTIKSPLIFPKVSIVDPELTLDLPPALTAATGIDALAHALEAYLNVNRTPFSDMVAQEAIRVIYRALPQVINNGHDIVVRTQMSWGSLLAGIAISNAGTTVAHALAQPLGARAHIPHSLAVAIFTVPVLRHSWPADVGRLADLARLIAPERVNRLSEEQQAKSVANIIEEMVVAVGMNRKTREFPVSSDIVDRLLDDVFSYMSRPLVQHPKQFSRSEMRLIIEEAIERAKVQYGVLATL